MAEVRSLLFRQNRSASDSPFFSRRVQSLVVLHVCFFRLLAARPPETSNVRLPAISSFLTFSLLVPPACSLTRLLTYFITRLLVYSRFFSFYSMRNFHGIVGNQRARVKLEINLNLATARAMNTQEYPIYFSSIFIALEMLSIAGKKDELKFFVVEIFSRLFRD